MLRSWIRFQLCGHSSEPDVAYRQHINPWRRWNSPAHLRILCFSTTETSAERPSVTSQGFVVWSVGEEEDDDADQQDDHQHHRREEDGTARRPARQLDQGLTRTARCAVIPRGWAGKPNVQGVV